MLAGTKHLLGAVMALLSLGHVSGQCVSVGNMVWAPCGYSSPYSCDRAYVDFEIHVESNCSASNPIVTVDFAGPIVSSGSVWGIDAVDGEPTLVDAVVSDDNMSITFDTEELGVDARDQGYYDYYVWGFSIDADNCDASYTWSDNFVKLSYVDDKLNSLDQSGFDDPYLHVSDTGTCPTPSPTPAPSPTPSPTAGPAPLSLGCYTDDRGDRILDLALSDSSMTTELCELTCLGNTYFGTQYGRECWCGSASADYASHGESTDCTYPCSGDADQTCGGFDAANIYRYTTTTTSSFVGCYQDDSDDRIMELALKDADSMTKEVCEEECTGSTYFGMQYGRECFCGGESTDLLEHGESTACDYECPGDSGQVCGGFYAMSVYSYS